VKLFFALLLTLGALAARGNDTLQAPQSPVDSKPPAASVEIYCDFRCPFCARLFNALLPMAKAENRRLTFRFRHFPFHGGSQELAQFFEAARTQQDADALSLIESLYRFQDHISPYDIPAAQAALATLHGLNRATLKRDLRARDVALAVRQDEVAAVAAKVDHTPSVFIDGTLLIGPPEQIAAAVLKVSPLAPPREFPPEGADCNVCKK
jgi:protein-disulfide isomerase